MRIKLCTICEKVINCKFETKSGKRELDSDEGGWFAFGKSPIHRKWFCNKCLDKIKEVKNENRNRKLR